MPDTSDFMPPSLAGPTPRHREERAPAPHSEGNPVRAASLRRMTMLPEDALLRLRQEVEAESRDATETRPERTGHA